MASGSDVLVIPSSRVRALLPMRACISAVSEALRGLEPEIGTFQQPLRFGYRLPQDEFSVLSRQCRPSVWCPRPATRSRPNATAVTSASPCFRATRSDRASTVIKVPSCFSKPRRAPFFAIVDATEVTAVRTAAASAVATRILAPRGESLHLAILGCGAQASVHLEAMLLVRPSICRVTVWSRTASRVEAFVERAKATGLVPERCLIEASKTAADAVRGADIICTLTSATDPILLDAMVDAVWHGHVHIIGRELHSQHAREIGSRLVQRAELYADSRKLV